jgi:hypothetical protein
MKKLLIFIAFFGFTATGSYAQTTQSCICKKTAHHKATHHQKFAVGIKTTRPPVYTNRTHNTAAYPGNDVWNATSETPVVNAPIDANSMEYNTESFYTGNYPKPTLQYTKVDPRENSDKRPNVDVLCLYDCPAREK